MDPAQAQGGVRLIKKYSNRKLYDTTSRQYITLERIGELVHGGELVRVIDRTTGSDLTAVTLSQVVVERERRRHAAAPEQLLQLVRGPGEAVAGAVRQSIAAGQDFLQRAEERVVRAPEAALEETLLRTLRSLKIPSHREMHSFDRRLRELSQRVEELAAAVGQPPAAVGHPPAVASGGGAGKRSVPRAAVTAGKPATTLTSPRRDGAPRKKSAPDDPPGEPVGKTARRLQTATGSAARRPPTGQPEDPAG